MNKIFTKLNIHILQVIVQRAFNFNLNFVLIAIPTELSYQEIVRKAIENVDLGRIESFIKDFTDFNNRYQDADTGVQSQEWLAQQVSNALEGYPGTYTFSLVNHGKWRQRSIIVRLHGSDAKVSNEVVILGAHQDSINHEGGDYMTTRAPGKFYHCHVPRADFKNILLIILHLIKRG